MKKYLIIFAFFVLILDIFISRNLLINAFNAILSSNGMLALIVIAIALQFVGHYFRSERTKLFIDQAAKSSSRFQYMALSIGYLFNMILPFRLGELIRSFIIADRLSISFSYTFVAVLIERSFDILFLSAIIMLLSLIMGGSYTVGLVVISSVSFVVAALILIILNLLKQENKYILSIVANVARIFNKKIGDSIKFKIWTLIFGLQSFFNDRRLIKRYMFYVFTSWIFYFISMAVIVGFLPIRDIYQTSIAMVAPYIAAVPSFQPMDMTTFNSIIGWLPIGVSHNVLLIFSNSVWLVLSLPMSVLGLFGLLIYKTTKKSKLTHHPESFSNKLLRYDDISTDISVFLDTYFKGHNLSKVLHKIEVDKGLSLVKFFKGGSDAITVLALEKNKLIVKKIVPAEYTDRLRVQYEWLMKYRNMKSIVGVLGEQISNDYYAINLEYDSSNVPFFELVHSMSLKSSKEIIQKIWTYVFSNIYQLKAERFHGSVRDRYVEDRLMKKIKKAIEEDENLAKAIKPERIVINGVVYDNFYTIMNKIMNHKNAWKDIGTFRESSAIHGDLTIDNILINPANLELLIIDPSDDNQIRGPVLDLGRMTQSLAAGYEFLNSDESRVDLRLMEGNCYIDYTDHRSARYMQLFNYMDNKLLDKFFTKSERSSALFHAGLFYLRMLAHRVHINPTNTLKYYAVGVSLLNKFYQQYDK
ncbi:flippase-like domain-containing protein [Candidatus Roizmanbacteria bacterium]|nr:flippase-like domain-containing protein [Candidatus Roizmanbacteria bacterium]